MITFATGCSGIGAPEVAWHDRLGWKPLWCSEIEPFPSAVLNYHWPDVPNVGDFLTIADRIARDELEVPDVFCAGTPCQAFSVAGLRNSLNDHRGGLTLEYIRIADAMDAQRKRRGLPETVFVWENVPGVFSTKDNAFGCFLGGMLGLDAPVVPSGGKWRHYGDLVAKRRLAWRVLDAQYFGVAQRRRRVFVVCTARPGVRPARALFELGCVPRTAPPSREAWAGSPSEAQGSARTASIRMRAGCAGGGKGALVGRELSNTLAGTNDQTLVSYGIGNGQAAEACDMQEELSQTLHCMHDGQAVMCAPINSMVIGKDAAPTDRQTTGIGDDGEPSPTLQANHHHAVAVAGFMGGQGEKAGSLGFSDEVAPTLKGAPSGSNQVPDVLVTGKQCVSTRNLSSALTGTEACPAHAKVVCYENNPTDARQKETDVSPSVLARWGTGGNQTPLVQPIQGFVRRLTTVECARLQGFPDHHTEIPWKKRKKRIVLFENGKKTIKYVRLPTPNGPQYKAYGNSMCTNVIEWLGRVIERQINGNETSKMAR